MSALSPSIKDKSENNEEGVLPTGLVKRLVIPDLDDGVVPMGLKLKGGLTISSFGLIHCLLSWSLEVGFFFCVPGLSLLLLVLQQHCCSLKDLLSAARFL